MFNIGLILITILILNNRERILLESHYYYYYCCCHPQVNDSNTLTFSSFCHEPLVLPQQQFYLPSTMQIKHSLLRAGVVCKPSACFHLGYLESITSSLHFHYSTKCLSWLKTKLIKNANANLPSSKEWLFYTKKLSFWHQ